jgi:hypothetical protein
MVVTNTVIFDIQRPETNEVDLLGKLSEDEIRLVFAI